MMVTSASGSSTGSFLLRVTARSPSGLERTLNFEVEVVGAIFLLDAFPLDLCLMRSDKQTSVISVELIMGSVQNVRLFGYWLPPKDQPEGKIPKAGTILENFNPENGTPSFDSTLTFTTTDKAEAGRYIFRVEAYDGGLRLIMDMEIKIKQDLTLTMDIYDREGEKAENFEKTQQIFIKGEADDPKGNRVENGKVAIKFTSTEVYGVWTETITDVPITNGKYETSYYIAFDKPSGEWTITAEAEDNHGNVTPARKKTSIGVSLPKAYTFYEVAFSRPRPWRSYERGEEVLVSVKVVREEEGLYYSVEGADVTLTTPRGRSIKMESVALGEYRTTYKLGWDEPQGEWRVLVLAEKTEKVVKKSGASYLPIEIKPIKLHFDVLSPEPGSKFEAGEEVEIEVEVTYGATGIIIDEAEVYASLPTENLSLLNRGGGIYGASPKFDKPLEFELQIFGSDAYGNSGRLEAAGIVTITPMSVGTYMIRYWWATFSGIFTVTVISAYVVQGRLRLQRLQAIGREREEIDRLREKAAIDYFREGAISRPDYDSLIKGYEQRLMELEKEEWRLRRKVKKKVAEK